MSDFWLMGFGFSVGLSLVAFGAGWWLRGVRLQKPRATAERSRPEGKNLAEQALAGLHAAAETVRTCVEEHTSCIHAIETQLRESPATEPAMIYGAADSIIAANGLVQHKITDIQLMLGNKQVELHDHLSDPYGLLCTFASLDRQKHVYRQVLGSLELLAMELMTNIAGHGQRLQKITNGLEEDGDGKLPDVSAAVAQIFEAADEIEVKIDSTQREIGEHAAKVEMQAVLGHVDLLTSLPNRRALEAEIEQNAARSHGSSGYFTMLLLDLDHFGQVNQQYGHQGGDVILRQTAAELKQLMRGRDMIARYSGDTFAILLAQTTLHDALPIADRIRMTVEQTEYSHGNYPLRLTASVGVAQWQQEENSEELSRRSTEALAAASEAGGNTCYWNDGKTSYPMSSAFRAGSDAGVKQSRVTMFQRSVTGGDADESAPETVKSPDEQLLTGRSLFVANLQRRMAEWKRGGPPLSVVVLAVDQLGPLTDRFGVGAATFLHGVMSRLLEASTREMDERCEFQNGQFAILLPGLDEANAVAVAERLQSQIRQCKVRMGDALWSITASIGVAPVSMGTTVVDVFQSAELAMKRAVERGGDAIYVGEPVNGEAQAAGVG